MSTSALTRPPDASALTDRPKEARAERGSSTRTRCPSSACVYGPALTSGMNSVATSCAAAACAVRENPPPLLLYEAFTARGRGTKAARGGGGLPPFGGGGRPPPSSKPFV